VLTREIVAFAVIAVGLFLLIAVSILKPVPEPWLGVLVIGIFLAITFVPVGIMLATRGVLPRVLVTEYLPLPLALVEPPSEQARGLFEGFILPAVGAVVKMVDGGPAEKAYDVVKRVREFFERELGSLSSVEAIQRRLAELGLYNDVENVDERKNLEYSMASLVHWVARYRNLAMHSHRVDPRPVDAWFALRVALFYIQARYRVDRARFYATCPRCRTVNVVELRGAGWLQVVTFRCVKCGHRFDVKLTPGAVLESYEVGAVAV